MSEIEKCKFEIERLCIEYKVNTLFVFGSYLTENYNSKSDIDLLVSFSKINTEDYADNYFDFKFSLQEILQRPIDLLDEKALKNPYLIKSINQQKQLIYSQ